MLGYFSTASRNVRVGSFREALFLGQGTDGGLFVPDRVPVLDVAALVGASFVERATAALASWLAGEFAPEVVAALCNFSFDFPVPVVPLDRETSLVELFHGPTAAFKDFGARFLARSLEAMHEAHTPLTILVATSGDTGGAVAHACADLAAARVILLYPAGRVSPLQELQLTAVPENVISFRVEGTFDDCLAMVRAALADADLVERLGLVAANSINVARLLPQTTYYVHAALEHQAAAAPAGAGMPGKHRPSAPRDVPPLVVVPAGNLGNLTAGVLARRQGAPLGNFIAAVNRNDAFARWLESGRLPAEPAVTTPSSAMDVTQPANLPRLLALYHGSRRDLRREIMAESIDDEETLHTIRWVYEGSHRFVCPHTAVALAALRRYRASTGDETPALVMATAHPGKFAEAVRRATGETPPLPPALAALAPARRAPHGLRADRAALVSFLRRMN
jgi:threonine synthase